MKEAVSIIIRTLNEEFYLPQCLEAIINQDYSGGVEIVLVDSCSTDRTVKIAEDYGCIIHSIDPREFSYGRALNLGLSKCSSDVVVALSGHCVPKNSRWLSSLTKPLFSGDCHMTFGHQSAGEDARTSEKNYFKFIYENISNDISMSDYFNNANSAFIKTIWGDHPFDEKIIMQEDVVFARHHQKNGKIIHYQKDASVVHYHMYNNKSLFKRVRLDSKVNSMLGARASSSFVKTLVTSAKHFYYDIQVAYRNKKLLRAFPGIFCYRGVEFWAILRGKLDL